MSTAKFERSKKQQMGQFMTPHELARSLIQDTAFTITDKILEPSMGDGSFIVAIIEKLLPLYDGSIPSRLDRILRDNLYGVELDPDRYHACLDRIRARWNHLPMVHNFVLGDFFVTHFGKERVLTGPTPTGPLIRFDHIIGNPPFGGSIDAKWQDDLDSLYGFRNGDKIKKETYSFFIVKSVDSLRVGGRLQFICSDTFLTIKTMRGLRHLLMNEGAVELDVLEEFSDETSHPMVLLSFTKGPQSDAVVVDGARVSRSNIEATENLSWRINEDLAKYFGGPTLGDFVVASSGMTTGKNEYFIREIIDGSIMEPYTFEIYDDPITLQGELARARLGHLSPRQKAAIAEQERAGATRRNVRIKRLDTPLRVPLPNPDYCYYNKANHALLYHEPTHVIYWKDDGDAVITYKKAGNWYLRGVGGQPFFKREGLTWALIAQHLNVRYLPAGYILDSGGPCAFLRDGITHDELWFILAWATSPLCTHLLKEVINHTKNIQGKDFERLPYPFWVGPEAKARVVLRVKELLAEAQQGRRFTRKCPEMHELAAEFAWNDGARVVCKKAPENLMLFASE